MKSKTTVSIVRNQDAKNRTATSQDTTSQESIDAAVKEAIDLLGGIESFVNQGDRVILKPNLAYPYPPPATTDPRVVEAVAKLCVEAGGKVGIGDSSSYSCKDILGYGKWNNDELIRRTGMDEAARNAGAKIIDFDTIPWKVVEIPDGIVLKKVEISSAMLDADVVINIPAMKSHFETLVTLGIKNYHGIIPDHYKIQFHKDEINQKLVDIHKAVKTHLTVMDGLVGMEGLGPRMGTPVEMNCIIASTDVVALDAVCSEVMGIPAFQVETTRLASIQGVGNGEIDSIEVLGVPYQEIRRMFRRPDVRVAGMYPGVTVIQGGPCVHCYGRAKILLETLKETGLPEYGGVGTVLVGVRPPNPELEDLEGYTVFVGDCALEGSSNLRYALGKKALCMEGCPPIPSLHRVVDFLKDEHEKQGD